VSTGHLLRLASPAVQAGRQPPRWQGAGCSSSPPPVTHLAEEEAADGTGEVKAAAAPEPHARGAPTTAVCGAQLAPSPPHAPCRGRPLCRVRPAGCGGARCWRCPVRCGLAGRPSASATAPLSPCVASPVLIPASAACPACCVGAGCRHCPNSPAPLLSRLPQPPSPAACAQPGSTEG